ncbi:MAG TPA: aminopeptidase [Chloroflexota bacterium]|nr:aminopeptidase [Chloroflexota bacterium]
MDPRVRKMAEVLVGYSIGVEPGQSVAIESPLQGEPLAVECVRAVLAAGGFPWTRFSASSAREVLLREGSDEQLRFISPLSRASVEEADASIAILAPENTRTLNTVDPAKITVNQQAHQPLLEAFMRRSASGELAWTAAMYPTQAAAQDAGMSLSEYEDFVYEACLLNEPDPVAAWQALGAKQQRVVDWLSGKTEIHISAPGTDFRVGIKDRTWLNDDGKKNFPGGEVFTGPIEDSAEGTVSFTFPGFYGGKEVQGIRLRFEAGKVVDAAAETNEDFLIQMLDTDAGARRLGELAIGTNQGVQAFTKNVLFDEKIGGTFHMALGASYPETGGTNESSIHWDIVCDLRRGGEIRGDGEILSQDGRFVP